MEMAFGAMGSDCRLVAVGDARGLADAHRLIDSLEARWSRFRPTSELSALNDAPGKAVGLTGETFTLVAMAVQAWQSTGGRFDPTVLPALLAAGYRRTFDDIGAVERLASQPSPGCGGIVLDDVTHTASLPVGVALDLGGIGKGRAADLAVAALIAGGADGALADLGGDVAVAGEPPDGADAWHLAVDDPFAPGTDLAVLRLADGAVASSSVLRRSWRDLDGVRSHHLIDPRTGSPACTDVVAATVLAGSASDAEVLAKAAIVAGGTDGADLIVGAGATGLLVLSDRRVIRLDGIERFDA